MSKYSTFVKRQLESRIANSYILHMRYLIETFITVHYLSRPFSDKSGSFTEYVYRYTNFLNVS